MKLKRIGVNLAKQVFQVHGVDSHEQVKCRKQLKRAQFTGKTGGVHIWVQPARMTLS